MQRAHVDESEPGGGRDHTAYVLAAVVLAERHIEPARQAVRDATPRRVRKLHWYEGLPGQRLSWLDLLRHAVTILVIRYDGAAARVERRRRRCLEQLVWELERRGIGHLVFESRGSAHDEADRSMLDALRRREIGRSVRHEHTKAIEEPLIALADLACGAHVSGLDHALDTTVVRIA